MLGTPARPAATSESLEVELPLLVAKRHGARAAGSYDPGHKGTLLYHDPQTGKMYREEEGIAENKRREAQRKVRLQESKMVSKSGMIEGTPGGTPEQRRQMEQRQEEIVRNRASQGQFSKEAAFADAQSLVNKSIADALEKAMPQITAMSEGAGTSRSTTAALMTQRAAERGAVEGAALGTQVATAYGGLSNQLAQTLEMLTRSDPNSPTALLIQALIGSKGLVSEQSGSQNTSGTQVKDVDTTQNVGPQETLQNTLKEILQPLNSMNLLQPKGGGQASQPLSGRVAMPNKQITIARGPDVGGDTDNKTIQINSGTEASIYGQYGEDQLADIYEEGY
jgi:hypothetical protein